MHRRPELYGVETVKICPNPRKTFRFGDGEQLSAMSYVELPQKLHRREISFSVYSLDVPRVPILMSIRTLKKLGAIVDFGERTVCFHKVDQSIVNPLTETRSGHLLIDLTKDWLNAAGNPEIGNDRPTYVTTSSRSGEQYMRAGEELCEGDQCVSSACVPAHDMSGNLAVPVFDLSSPELDRPVEECDECLQMGSAIARPTSQFAFALACGVHGAAAPGGADTCAVHPVGDFNDGILGLPGEEEGPEGEGQDSRGRALRLLETGRPQGRANSWSTLLRRAPDHEARTREPFRFQRPGMVASVREVPFESGVRASLGRTRTLSPSRSSQRGCEEGGARGHAKNVALEGAEQSLLDKLGKVRAEKEKSLAKSKGAQAKSKAAPSSMTTSTSPAPATPSVVNLTVDQTMNVTPGRKKHREHEMTAEEQEYKARDDSWSSVEVVPKE